MNPIYYIELELETKEVDGVKKKVKKHCVAAWLSMQTIRKNRRRKDKIIINTRQAKISLYTPFEVSLIYDCDLSKTSIYGIAPWHRKNVSETITLGSEIWNSCLASRHISNLLTGSIYVIYCFDPYISEQVNKETGKYSFQFHGRRWYRQVHVQEVCHAFST